LRLEELLRQRGENDEADALLVRESTRFPQNIELVERAAERAKSKGQWSTSVDWYERALSRVTDPPKRRRLLEHLQDGALETQAFPDAQRYHERLLDETTADATVDEAWARGLLAQRQLETALTVITKLSALKSVTAASKATLWRDLARAELLAGLATQAEMHVERARQFASNKPGLLSELDVLSVEVARTTGNLEQAILHLESKSTRPPRSRRLLATLYAETGHTDRAINLLQRELAQRRNDPELHFQLCQVLELSGQLTEALHCLEDVVRDVPERLDLVLGLVEKLTRRGEHEKAIEVLVRAERNVGRTATALTTLADAWERLGEHQRASLLLKRTQPPTARYRSFPTDVDHDTPNQDQRLSSKFLAQAEQLVESGNVEQALSLVEQFSHQAPRLPQILVRTAKVYERAVVNGKGRDLSLYEKAEILWREVIDSPQASDVELTAAIEHVVRIWTLQGKLSLRTTELTRRFSGTVPRLPQALWLAEAESRRGRFDRATAVLLTVLSTTKNPWLPLRRLEQLAVAQSNYDAALVFAERRLAAPTASDRSNYATLVDYATKTRTPSKALVYAINWTVNEPNRPAAFATLARLERQASRLKQSRDTLSHAYELDRSQYDYLLELALWYKADDDVPTAVTLAKRLLRSDQDETRLLSAYYLIVSLATTPEKLVTVEQALRAALGNAPQSVRLRDALLSLYEQLLTSTPDASSTIVDAGVSQRATLVLIESLSDNRESVQEVAIRLLEQTQPRQAALALLRFAKENEFAPLGRRALVLLGQLRAPEALPPLIEWLKTSDLRYKDSPFSLAAFYCLAQYRDGHEKNTLRKLLVDSGSAYVAMSALALAARRDISVVPHLRTLVSDPRTLPLARAAAALGLHFLAPNELNARLLSKRRGSRLEQLVEIAILADSPSDQRFTAISELLCDDNFADPAFADATARLSTPYRPNLNAEWQNSKSATDPESLILALTRSDGRVSSKLNALKLIARPLSQACLHRIVLEPEQARHLGRVLIGDGTAVNWGPLVPDVIGLSQEEQTLRAELLDHSFAILQEGFGRYRAHPDPELREIALGLLSLGSGDPAAVLSALTDRLAVIREKAIGWSYRQRTEPVVAAVSKRLLYDPEPRIRTLAAARLGDLPPGKLPQSSVFALRQAARRDAFASVRMAALRSLKHDNPLAAKRELSYAESSDQEPEARELARKLLESQP
jgi:tetratricopeptide (TPR) repeat protein